MKEFRVGRQNMSPSFHQAIQLNNWVQLIFVSLKSTISERIFIPSIFQFAKTMIPLRHRVVPHFISPAKVFPGD
jgi:hypothetical protein